MAGNDLAAGIRPRLLIPGGTWHISRVQEGGSHALLGTTEWPASTHRSRDRRCALNGLPNLSVLDGWWVEACREGRTGWAIGQGVASDRDAHAPYDKLEHAVLPPYYEDHSGWIAMMKQAIAKGAAYFNSQRMMRRYASEAYLR